MDEVYIGSNNNNTRIFKMVDRYKFKIALICIFSVSICFNLFETIFGIVSLTVYKSKSEDYSYGSRIFGSIICLMNILVTFILSSITVQKLKIKTSIFY